jgi:hypothetical protein
MVSPARRCIESSTPPFDAPDLLTLCEGITERPSALVTALFEVIAGEAAGAGIKLTPKGNLPRSVVANAWAAVQAQGLRPEFHIGAVRNEEDFEALHVTRLIAELGRLTRKNRGRLLLVKTTQQRLDRGDWSGLYRNLLQTYCHGFNWPYSDGYPVVPIIQQGCFFSLYLFARYGEAWRPASFYADAFLHAFPMAVAEIPQQRSTYVEPEEDFHRVWELRTVHRFAHYFGLVELRPDPNPRPRWRPIENPGRCARLRCWIRPCGGRACRRTIKPNTVYLATSRGTGWHG